MIEAIDVSKVYGRFQALKGVTFKVDRGRSVALWGRNGAGKTTTIRCILGMTSFRGEIRVGGVDVAKEGVRARRLLGYVPQQLPRFDMQVGELAAFMARLRGEGSGAASVGAIVGANGGAPIEALDPEEEARQRLDEVGLSPHAGKPVQALSGGMRQRLALALARLGDPPVLLLDEPTASLDTYGRDELFELLGGVKDRGITIVFASHRPDEIKLLADETVVMDEGRVVEQVAARDWWEEKKWEEQDRKVRKRSGLVVRLNRLGGDRREMSRR